MKNGYNSQDHEDTRRRKVVIICGESEIGKSTQTRGIIENYTDGMVTALDFNSEIDYLAEIPLEMVPKQNKGNYKVTTVNWQRFIELCRINYPEKGGKKKGLIVFEDASGYIKSQEHKPLMALMTGVRHRKLDILFIFHQLWRIPPFVMDQAQELVLFKTGEAQDKGDVKKFRHGDRIMKAFEEVEKNPNVHHFEIVKLTGYYE